MRSRTMWKALVVFLALACSLVLPRPALASDGGYDPDEVGSISISLLDGSSKASVPGAGFTLYRVADAVMDGYNLSYVTTSEYSGFTAGLGTLDATTAANLSTYTAQKGIAGVASTATDASGKASFNNLTPGVYLVRQGSAADGYYSCDPFLVAVPTTIDGQWVYDVDASPKVEASPVTSTTVTTTGTTSSKLIQTGQLNWPVPVLAVGGVVLFALGWWLVFTKRKNKRGRA